MRVSKIIIGLLVIVLATVALGSIQKPDTRIVHAQGANLLQNPNFDPVGWYQKQGIDGQIPGGWNIWANGQPPATDYNQFLPYTRSAPGSWILKGGFVAWTGGGYQTVTAQQNVTYRFTIYGFTWTCNDLEYSCTGPSGRSSDKNFGSRVKVGIDPLGGTDPNAGTVYWTVPQEAYDSFFPLTIDAVAQSTQMTVFFYSTVSAAPALRETYWDDASLVALGEGQGNPVNSAAAPNQPTEPPIQVVPFVSPQSAQSDGSVVHTVAEGDTFDSIYVAYRHLGVTRENILQLNGWDEPPRWIIPGEKIKILPPGSVNPTTGQLIPRNATATPSPTATAGTPATATTPTTPIVTQTASSNTTIQVVKGG